MRSWRRDKSIVFQRATQALAGLGTKGPGSWADIGGRLASVQWGGSQERREAGVEGAAQSASFRCLADSLTRTVTVKDRIRFAGLTWDVTGMAEIGRNEIEFSATATRG